MRPTPKAAARNARTAPADPNAYWAAYYRKHADSPAQLRQTVATLREGNKLVEVEAALRAYLIARPANAEAWMYQALALAIEVNKGKPEEVETYLGYAATVAMKLREPNQLVAAADALYLRGKYERVGALIDLAAERVPHRVEPLMMSVNLALKQEDPTRMAEAVEALLAIGWPGVDAKGVTFDSIIRRDARASAEALAKSLRESGRGPEADALLVRLPEAEIRDLYIKLTWAGDSDLDLVVEEPLGATARYETPRTVFGGSILKNGEGRQPEEVYVCPRGFDGDYAIRVETIFADPAKPVLTANLQIITHEGAPTQVIEIKQIDLSREDPIVVKLTGGRRKTALPFVAPPGPALQAARSRPGPSAPPAPK